MSGDFKIVMNSGWHKWFEDQAEDYLQETCEAVLEDMKRECPVNTGRLRDSLDIRMDGLEAKVGSFGVDYAYAVEDGTRPHTIKAKGKALSWPDAEHPVTEVNHPGQQATHFMRRATYKSRGH